MAAEILHPTNTGIDSRKLAMWAFLASDCMGMGGSGARRAPLRPLQCKVPLGTEAAL